MELGKLYTIAGGVYEIMYISYSGGHVTFKSWNENSLGEEQTVSMVGNSVQRMVPLRGEELRRLYDRTDRQVKVVEDKRALLLSVRDRLMREWYSNGN